MTMTITLPYPPSANRYWKSFAVKNRAVVCLSGEAKAYKKLAARILAASSMRPQEGPLHLDLKIYRPRKVGDTSNRIKVVEDALNGFAYRDDEQITKITAERFDDKANPRVEVTVSKIL